MEIYNSIILLIILFSVISCVSSTSTFTAEKRILSSDKSDRIQYSFFVFIMATLFIISALRAPTVGTDMARYIPRFNYISITSWGELASLPQDWGFEIGFVVFCKTISSLFGNNQQMFTMVSALIISIGFFSFIKKYSNLPLISVLVYVCYGYWGNSFNTVRQYISISLLILSLCKWDEKKTKSAAILFFSACALHASSIIFLIVLLLRRFKYTGKSTICFLVVGCIFYFLPESVLNWVLMFTSYEGYIGREGSGETTLVVLVCILIISMICKKQLTEIDSNIDLWLWMLSISICAGVLALHIGLFERIMRYFMVALLMLVPDLIVIHKRKPYYIVVFGGAVFVFILYYYVILMNSSSSSGGIIPYEFFDWNVRGK